MPSAALPAYMQPTRDPGNRPDLERALPADDQGVTGHRDERSTWDVKFGDGGWRPVTVRAWWLDRHGRQVVQIEWFAELATWSGEFLVDQEKMSEG